MTAGRRALRRASEFQSARCTTVRLTSAYVEARPPTRSFETVPAEFDEWLTGRGYRMVTHRDLPPKGRWIGVIEMGFGRDHCLLMLDDQVLLDPTSHLGLPVRLFGLEHLAYGVTFENL